MDKKIIFALGFSTLFLVQTCAKDFNMDELKAKARQYREERNKAPDRGIDGLIAESPQSRFIDEGTNEVTAEDKRHVLVHMKLANRHFAKKNYPKAIEEVDIVFKRDPSNSGGHFMRAVIAGRQKDYTTAWYHISIAKEKSDGNQKIDDFITKLKTVSSEPENPKWIAGIYKGIQTAASNRTFDLLDKLLQDNCSQNITSIESGDYKSESDNKTTFEITMKALDQFSPDKIIGFLRKTNGSGVLATESANNNLKLKITYKELQAENVEAKAIKGINDFIADLTEEMPEIAINNTDEGEPKQGIQEITYSISARNFSSINSFMRQISPFATKYLLLNMGLAYIPGSKSTIWNSKIRVFYKVGN